MTDIDLTDSADDRPDHIGIDDAAVLMGIAPTAAERLVENRTFPVPVVTIGERVLVPRARLVRWIEGWPEGDGGTP